IRRPPRSTPFPYTRSSDLAALSSAVGIGESASHRTTRPCVARPPALCYAGAGAVLSSRRGVPLALARVDFTRYDLFEHDRELPDELRAPRPRFLAPHCG